MATDRRRAAATASSGAVLTTAGGVLRHKGTAAANHGKIPAWELRHPLATHQTRALLRTGARGRKRYLLGATLGLVGAPALAVGIHDTVTRKRDDRHSFVREGIRGTQDALEQRAEGITEVPPQHRAGPFAVSAGSGLVGSLAAHRALDRVKGFQGARHGARAGITALAGTAVAGASYPLARHTVRSKEYEVTPTGVRRRKKVAVRPSSKGKVFDAKRMSRREFRNATVGEASKGLLDAPIGRTTTPHGRADVFEVSGGRLISCGREGDRMVTRALPRDWSYANTRQPDPAEVSRRRKQAATLNAIRPHTASERARRAKRDERGRFTKAAGDYAGRRTSTHAQRAAILAAGATPIIGGIAGARTAGHFAPPKERTRTEARQYGMTAAGSLAGGVAGAYGTAAVASRHAGVAHATERAAEVHGRAAEKVRNLKPVNAAIARLPKGSGRTSARVARAKDVARGSKLARPLARAPIAAGVGYVAGKTIGGYAGSGLAMRHNQADQREYNLKHPVTKYAENMTVAERRKMSRKKRIAALSSTTTGVLGLGALGALALKRPKLQTGLLTSGAAISGANNLNFAGVLRREAKAQDPDKHVKKMAPRIVYHGTNKEAARTIRYTGKLRAGRSSQRNEVYVSPHKKIAAAYAGRRVAGKNEATDEARRILAERKQQHGGPGHVVRMWAVGPSSEPEHRGAVRAFAGSAYHPNNVHVATTRTVPTLSRLAEDTNRKSFGVPVVKADVKHMAWHSGGSACGMISAPKHRLTTQWSRVTCHGCRKARWLFGKADRREPLSRMRADQAAQIVRRHGDAGPLPSNLSRPERMQAYEARYVHAGGHKAEHWQRRADRADKVKVAGLAGATAGGAAIMALRHPRLAARLGHRAHAARHAADTATIGAATVSGAGELYAGHARRRRASYSNSKAGVAASALRRMRDYAA